MIETVLWTILTVVLPVMVPAIVAYHRHVPSRHIIAVGTLLLGWWWFFWIGLLLWALLS